MSRITVNQEKLQAYLRRQRTDERAVPEKLLRALEIVAEHLLDPATLATEEIPAVAEIYPDWEPDQLYKQNRVLNYKGTLVKVLQEHTSQADWLPDATDSLYTAFRPPGAITDWTQPTGAHDAFNTGDEVRYGGLCYRSKIDANTTVPGSDDRWWEEIVCP